MLLTGSHLDVNSPVGNVHDFFAGPNSLPRIEQAIGDADFEIVVKWESDFGSVATGYETRASCFRSLQPAQFESSSTMWATVRDVGFETDPPGEGGLRIVQLERIGVDPLLVPEPAAALGGLAALTAIFGLAWRRRIALQHD